MTSVSTSETAAPEPTTEEKHSSNRRDQIVAIAMDLFAEKGFQPVSVREIAEQAGILSGSLYTHVASKHELLELGLRPYARVALADVRTVVDADISSREKLTKLVQQSFTSMVQWRAAAAVMYREWEFLSTLDEFAYLRELNEEVQQLWLRVIREAVDDGTLSPDIEPAILWRLLLALMEGMARRYNPKSRYSLETISAYPIRMLFGGLGGGIA